MMKELPIHEVHRLKAIENYIMADRAINSEEPLYEQAIMHCHFMTELIMKSAIYKAGGTPPTSGPDGHNLLKIADVKVGKRKLLHAAIISNRFMVPLWQKIGSAWETNKRYEFMDLLDPEFDELYAAYRRFFVWIKTTFVE